MEKIYNKLVRDKIPQIIEADNEIPFTRILNDKEYEACLFKKLKEECNEVIDSTKEECLEELGDLLEVMISIANLNNNTLEDIIRARENKKNKKGAFKEKIYLEKTIKKE